MEKKDLLPIGTPVHISIHMKWDGAEYTSEGLDPSRYGVIVGGQYLQRGSVETEWYPGEGRETYFVPAGGKREFAYRVTPGYLNKVLLVLPEHLELLSNPEMYKLPMLWQIPWEEGSKRALREEMERCVRDKQGRWTTEWRAKPTRNVPQESLSRIWSEE